MADRQRPSEARSGVRPESEQDALNDERVVPVRPSRLLIGLIMIVVAALWLAIDNRLGLVDSTLKPVPSPGVRQRAPALATPQALGGIVVDARLVGRQGSLAGRSAPPGREYLLIAVLLTNRGHQPLAVAPSEFSVVAAGRQVALGAGYPGHGQQLSVPDLRPGSRVEGILVFSIPGDLAAAELRFTPQGAPAGGPLRWYLPGE